MTMHLLLSLFTHVGAQIYVSQEQFMDPMQIIANRGYPAEAHNVTTSDGYILTMHRIPHGKSGSGGGRPVMLQHGLLSSSFDFLTTQASLSLSYSLADAGYDVWLGNNRGNIYSNAHFNYSNTDSRFWNFSWDEMSLYDYPAMINYVLNTTNQPNMYLLGHSQGGHTFFTSTTANPDIQAKVKYFFALAPSLSTMYLGSALMELGAQNADMFNLALAVTPNQVYSLPVLGGICGTTAIVKTACRSFFDEISGPIDQIDDSQLPLVTAHFPAGTSNKNWKHWLQQATNGTKYFDYGVDGNLAAYGTTYPREFDFSGYTVPTSIYFSPEDKLVSTQDMIIAFSRLPASAIVKSRNMTSGYGHFEFIWGNRAKAEIYNEIIADINAMEGVVRELAPDAAMLLLLSLLSNVGAQIYITTEQFMNPTQIIAHRGYPVEQHTVTTVDGYILTMHRIPHGRSGPAGGRPVFLQHGLLSSSFDFLTPSVNSSLSYSLADAGYDVWLGNNRGNIYSNSHISYSNWDSRYWNFSWDEMSLFDYPAMINYVLNVTNQPNLYLVGHSQGGHTFFTSTTAHPEIQTKVKYFFALAPSLSSLHLGSALLRLAVEFPDVVEIALDIIPDEVYSLPALDLFCGTTAIVKTACRLIFDVLSGPIDQINDNQLPLFTAHVPGGTSNKNWKHWLQQATNGTKYYNYGTAGNLVEYGTPYPREFDFSGYSVPTSIYFSPEDKLVSNQDIIIALARLPVSAIVKKRNLTGYSHFEFIWGNRAKAEIYNEIIADINAMEGKG